MSWGVSAIAAIATMVFGWLTALRAQYERVLNVINHLDSDRVAEARHQLGLIIHQGSSRTDVDPASIQHLFVVLWAINRIDAVRGTLPPIRWFWPSGPHRLLRDSTEQWVRYWGENHAAIANLTSADTSGSDAGLNSLMEKWKLGLHP